MPSLLADLAVQLPPDLAPDLAPDLTTDLLPDLARALYLVVGVLAVTLLAVGFARIVGDNFRRDPQVAIAAFPRHLGRVLTGVALLAALMVTHSALTPSLLALR